VSPRIYLVDVERRKMLSSGLELRPLGRRARSQSLYRLCYTVWTTWLGEKSCPYWKSNSDPSAVQPLASRYVDCAIQTLLVWCDSLYNVFYLCIIFWFVKFCIECTSETQTETNVMKKPTCKIVGLCSEILHFLQKRSIGSEIS
jgi:hypothetical protein